MKKTKKDWFARAMHRLKESNLKRLFFPIARLEEIEMFLAFACFKNFKIYQMDVKSTFLNGDLEGKVYVEQSKGLTYQKKRDYVCQLKKALYGIKQAPKAWYARLYRYPQQQGFKRGFSNSNIYDKMEKDNLLVTVVYVDDIIFGSNNGDMCHSFARDMSKELKIQ